MATKSPARGSTTSSQPRQRVKIAGASRRCRQEVGGRDRQPRGVRVGTERGSALEEFLGYPGPSLMAALAERVANDDALGAARSPGGSARLAHALVTTAASDWEPHADIPSAVPDVLPPTLGRPAAAPPYFEILIVTRAPANHGRRSRRSGAACDARRRVRLRAGPRRERRGRGLRGVLNARFGPS